MCWRLESLALDYRRGDGSSGFIVVVAPATAEVFLIVNLRNDWCVSIKCPSGTEIGMRIDRTLFGLKVFELVGTNILS